MSSQPEASPPEIGGQLRHLDNQALVEILDLVLLELERRLFRYAHVGGEVLEMADEGLVLAARAAARLGQAQSSAMHAQNHLQVVGVGGWAPSTTRPTWSDDPRIGEGEPEERPG